MPNKRIDEMIPEEMDLVIRIQRIIEKLPIGTVDLLHVLTHPDIIEYTKAYIAAKEEL